MIYILMVIICLLIGVILLQVHSKKKRDDQIQYMTQKLHDIVDNHTSENLLVFTDDKDLVRLLMSINHLLNHNQKLIADHARNEESIRKMVSNISHDLKTPLTVIVGYLEILKEHESVKQEMEKEVTVAHHKAVELLGLINEFFDLAKLESGDKEIKLEKVNLNEICKKSILEFHTILREKDWTISIMIPEEPIHVIGNEDALNRILRNLLSNAIKYGSDGQTIGLTVEYDRSFAYIKVWDKGKGIQEASKEKVFERLYTLEDSRNKLYQGSGLGLTITKRLVESLEGTISLSSEPFVETVFTVRLKKLL